MNKKLIALALVLFIAVGGLFAVARDLPAVATLEATVASTFEHGFTDSTGDYKSSVKVENAFAATPPTLKYGFNAKSADAFTSTMTISNFKLDGGAAVVEIDEIYLNNETTPASPTSEGKYKILSYLTAEIGQSIAKSVNIRVFPKAAQVTAAAPGTYVSTISVEIVSET
jgi:hypothetical protein